MDHERFASAVQLHARAMVRAAMALVGAADAEDAAQEAVLRAWQAWDSLRDPEAARSWLVRITVNVCRNWEAGHFGTHRRRSRPLATDDDLLTLDVEPLTIPGPDAPEHAAALEHAAIGDALDLPAATVRTRLRRALALLRETLRDEDASPASPAVRHERGIPHD